jgi:hypothetical protein
MVVMPGHMNSDELQRFLFAGSQHRLQTQVGAWLVELPRFRAFVEAHRDKIRKKARMMREEESRLDLLVELGMGYRLLHEKRFTLAYELFAENKTRGPDYVVTYTTKFTFTVEVTRLRFACDVARWADVICEKLRQLPPAQPNVVVVATGAGQCADFDLAQPLGALRTLADRKEDAFFVQRGWRDARDFLRQLPRLSAVLWWDGWDAPTGGTWMLWLNAQAKHPLPREARAALSS